jgi:hypothetical protein
MKKFIILASAGLLLFSLQGARAQRQVEPPAVPPMLEGQKPLAQPETREPAAPKQTEADKAKPKAKTTPKTTAKTKAKATAKSTADKKAQKKAAAPKEICKKPPKVVKKKSLKNQKKKPPEAAPTPQVGPDEG